MTTEQPDEPLRVGAKPGPRSEHWLATDRCWQRSPGIGLLCTRASDHTGDHAACGSRILAVWA